MNTGFAILFLFLFLMLSWNLFAHFQDGTDGWPALFYTALVTVAISGSFVMFLTNLIKSLE